MGHSAVGEPVIKFFTRDFYKEIFGGAPAEFTHSVSTAAIIVGI
jgi:hypothetical protein